MQIYNLFTSILMSSSPDVELQKTVESGLLLTTFPEVAAMINFGGGKSGHKDLWSHTKQVVCQTIPKDYLRWAALFHDVGKVKTLSYQKGKVTFHGHEFYSAKLFSRAAKRIKMESELIDKIDFLIANLGLIESYEPEWTDSAVRRLAKNVGEHLPDLLALSRADITTKHQDRRKFLLKRIVTLNERIEKITLKDAKIPPLPKGVGDLIMKEFNLPASRKIGEIRNILEQAVADGELPPQQEVEFYVKFVRENSKRFGINIM